MSKKEPKPEVEMMYVEWIDSGISLDSTVWQTEEDVIDILNNNMITETIGIVLYEDKNWLFLAQTINGEQIRGGYCIYKKNIVARYTLKRDVEDIPSPNGVEFEHEEELIPRGAKKQ